MGLSSGEVRVRKDNDPGTVSLLITKKFSDLDRQMAKESVNEPECYSCVEMLFDMAARMFAFALDGTIIDGIGGAGKAVNHAISVPHRLAESQKGQILATDYYRHQTFTPL